MQSDEQHQINDIDLGKHLVASATTEGNVKFRRFGGHALADFHKPYFINASSKTVKTYLSHPNKPGVHMVKIA